MTICFFAINKCVILKKYDSSLSVHSKAWCWWWINWRTLFLSLLCIFYSANTLDQNDLETCLISQTSLTTPFPAESAPTYTFCFAKWIHNGTLEHFWKQLPIKSQFFLTALTQAPMITLQIDSAIGKWLPKKAHCEARCREFAARLWLAEVDNYLQREQWSHMFHARAKSNFNVFLNGIENASYWQTNSWKTPDQLLASERDYNCVCTHTGSDSCLVEVPKDYCL